ncbi:hypothetical protein [Nocardiopsis dassonvillei]|uniref:hypothetical protein n=1 Tax=Nocardiopsis dassonvillei TaxID=2014 RepID=UPI000B9D6DBA|nr:hypothetical protein [Nocardiopsis dassonvillei]ASU59163.1 hypothetical protein CGQ36_17035 [Nocardiopsis dassonvillei]
MEIDLSRIGKSEPLPPYRAVLAVDMEKFSRTSARNQQLVGQKIPEVLEKAFTRADMLPVWKDARFPRHSGDGYVMGAEPEHLPYLISPFLEELQRVLEQIQPLLAAHDRNLRMRLRASIDVGPLPDTGDGSGIDAMGEAMISTHRLLDSEPVRRELEASDPDTTLLATIVSRRVYEDVVLGGFAPVRASRWRPVHASVPSKDFQAEGYLFVPTPSWVPGAHAESEAAPAPERDRRPAGQTPAAPGGTAPTTGNNVGHNDRGQVVQAGTVNGGVSFGGMTDER